VPVIVTRPLQEATAWVERLRHHGVDAVALPLIAIGPAPEPRELALAWARLPTYHAVMFVSANAVRGFFANGPAAGFTQRAWAPGPGTADALVQAGVPPDTIDQPDADSAQFDSEALWETVASQLSPGARVLVVRGADAEGLPSGREWLREQAEAVGAQVDSVAAYVRSPPAWGKAELDLARRAMADGSVWIFSSSEAVANLQGLLPGGDWHAARAVATHPRIAESARNAGFGVVRESRPALEEVLASLQWAG
jgi:uroporphyrinogen-III synthase